MIQNFTISNRNDRHIQLHNKSIENLSMKNGKVLPNTNFTNVIISDNVKNTIQHIYNFINSNNNNNEIIYNNVKTIKGLKENKTCDVLIVSDKATKNINDETEVNVNYSSVICVLDVNTKLTDCNILNLVFKTKKVIVNSVLLNACTRDVTNRLYFNDTKSDISELIVYNLRVNKNGNTKVLIIHDKPTQLINKINRIDSEHIILSDVLNGNNKDDLCKFYNHNFSISKIHLYNEIYHDPYTNIELDVIGSSIMVMTKTQFTKYYHKHEYGFNNISCIISHDISQDTVEYINQIKNKCRNMSTYLRINTITPTEIINILTSYYCIHKYSKNNDNMNNCDRLMTKLRNNTNLSVEKPDLVDKIIKHYKISKSDKEYMKRKCYTYLFNVNYDNENTNEYNEMYNEQMKYLYILDQDCEPRYDFENIESLFELKSRELQEEIDTLNLKGKKKLSKYSGAVWIMDDDFDFERDYYADSHIGFIYNETIYFSRVLASHKFTRRYKKDFMKEKVNKDKKLLFLTPVFASMPIKIKKSKFTINKSIKCILNKTQRIEYVP